MAEQLAFSRAFTYDLRQSGITVPVLLSAGGNVKDPKAKIDTGSSLCIFARYYGERIGLQIEAGIPQSVSTATGSFTAYGHEVSLSVLELSFVSTVYFAADPAFQRNVLGRQGWLDRIRLGLVDYEGRLYLSDYNDLAA